MSTLEGCIAMDVRGYLHGRIMSKGVISLWQLANQILFKQRRKK